VATHHLPSIMGKTVISCSHVIIHIQWSQRMNLYLLTILFIQYPLSFMINITCNLSKATKGILVTNVACDSNLVVETIENRCFSSSATIFQYKNKNITPFHTLLLSFYVTHTFFTREGFHRKFQCIG